MKYTPGASARASIRTGPDAKRKAARSDADSLGQGSRLAYSVRMTFLLKRWFSAARVQK